MRGKESNEPEEANSHTAETQLEARARSMDYILRTKGSQPKF